MYMDQYTPIIATYIKAGLIREEPFATIADADVSTTADLVT